MGAAKDALTEVLAGAERTPREPEERVDMGREENMGAPRGEDEGAPRGEDKGALKVDEALKEEEAKGAPKEEEAKGAPRGEPIGADVEEPTTTTPSSQKQTKREGYQIRCLCRPHSSTRSRKSAIRLGCSIVVQRPATWFPNR